MTLADRIVVMNAGHVDQVGTPMDLYDRPVNLFVAGFIGSPSMNFIAGRVGVRADSTVLVCADGHEFPLPAGPGLAPGRAITLGVRPEHLRLADASAVSLRVDIVEPTGDETNLYGKVGDELVCVRLHQRVAVVPGQAVPLSWPLDRLHVFDTASGQRIRALGECVAETPTPAPAILHSQPRSDCATSSRERTLLPSLWKSLNRRRTTP
jgi:multiple sugar transport system ATP-binding protein